MKYCWKCGSSFNENFTFCPSCGDRLMNNPKETISDTDKQKEIEELLIRKGRIKDRFDPFLRKVDYDILIAHKNHTRDSMYKEHYNIVQTTSKYYKEYYIFN